MRFKFTVDGRKGRPDTKSGNGLICALEGDVEVRINMDRYAGDDQKRLLRRCVQPSLAITAGPCTMYGMHHTKTQTAVCTSVTCLA